MIFLGITGYEIVFPLFMALLVLVFVAQSYVDALNFP